ncbi:chitin synthase chs-2-like [Mya arenaria]|uniref:chitin synthase chs-2-like n=1 Tax=Mya arenaria TaxID=6604 RepID=UPI0022DF18E5|nr:chitin synthase chs-2-like [Mya arenaria]XP_052814222.1 chitin synthase chs-2-like [Mya arenaria]
MPTQQILGEAPSGQLRNTGQRQPPSGQSTPQSTLSSEEDNPLTKSLFVKKGSYTEKKDHMQEIKEIWLFSGSLYDFFFPDLNMLLRRRNDHEIGGLYRDSVQQGDDVPKVIICVTILDLHLLLREEADNEGVDGKRTEDEKQDAEKITIDSDKINIEVQIVFDDAFCSTKNGREVNEYLLQFMSCLQKAVGSVLKDKELVRWNKTFKKKMVQTPYGGQFILQLPGGTHVTVHLKDKKKIRARKRWSQVMYMYYCLLYKMEKAYPDTFKDKLKNTFILTLDGDVDFKPKSVLRMMDRMKMNSRVGAVCGRIHPIGSGPMVWYQQFEYAAGHWLQKACEHIFGSVLCCPGCFSIFRASALVDDNVLKTYTREPEAGIHLVQFEQGEDRWLCTLLLKRGYKIDYCAASDAKTFAPENFWDFFVQRRRWSPSTLANMMDLVLSWKQLVQNNAEINHFFMLYQLVLVVTSIIAPGTVLVMIAGSFSSVLSLKPWHAFFVAVTPVVLFAVLCLTVTQKKQLIVAAILSTAYTFVMVIVTIGMILNIVSETVLSPNVIFLIFVGLIFLISALLHPQEFTCLFPGLLYFVSVPSTFIFLTVFYVCNLHDISWGTRESKSQSSQSEVESGNKRSSVRLLLTLAQHFLQAKVAELDSNGLNLDRIEQQSQQVEEIIDNEDDSYWIKVQLTDSKQIRAKTKAQEFQEHLKEIEHDLEMDAEVDEPPPDYMSEPDVDYDDSDGDTVADVAYQRKCNIYRHRIQTVRNRKRLWQPIDARMYHMDGGNVDGSFLRPGLKYPNHNFLGGRTGD